VRAIALVFIGAGVCCAVGACTSPAHAPAPRSSLPGSSSAAVTDRALRSCETALGAGVESAIPATVGEIRAWSGGPMTSAGPAYQPGKYAFPGEPAGAFAAWCWTGQNGHWTSWGVDENQNKVDFGDFSNPGQTVPPTGALAMQLQRPQT
jgi:hypothetical protein